MSSFKENIRPHVEAELAAADEARMNGDLAKEFQHFEKAHVLGQESTYWHTKVHIKMLLWGVRNHSAKEIIGQTLRIIGAFTKTAIGLVPEGNTGGTNISPFKKMPIQPDILDTINQAKAGV